MPKSNSNVQNEKQLQDFYLLNIFLENSGCNIKLNSNELKIENKEIHKK